MKKNRSHPRRRGFTLVETVVAMGIMATGLLAMVALVAPALEAMSESTITGNSTRIAERLAAETLASDWDDLTDGPARYYDDQGFETTAGSATVTFVAQVRVTGKNVHLPGVGAPEPHLNRIVVAVAYDPSGQVTYANDPERFEIFPVIAGEAE